MHDETVTPEAYADDAMPHCGCAVCRAKRHGGTGVSTEGDLPPQELDLGLPPCGHELAGDDDLTGVTDARRWAERFTLVRHNLLTGPERRDIADDEGAMLGWFANAIEAGCMAADSDSRAAGSAGPLPPGIYGRVELPGFRSATGWMTEGTLAGQPVMVMANRAGEVLGEYVLGPASRFVRLQVPETVTTAEPLRAITASSWGYDDDGRRDDDAGNDKDPF